MSFKISHRPVPDYADMIALRRMVKMRSQDGEGRAIQWLVRFADYWEEKGYDVDKYRRDINYYAGRIGT